MRRVIIISNILSGNYKLHNVYKFERNFSSVHSYTPNVDQYCEKSEEKPKVYCTQFQYPTFSEKCVEKQKKPLIFRPWV